MPHHALQLVFYAAGIARVQGRWPTHVHVQLGSGRRETIRVLFSRDRLNVAISRARCLAYLVCAPALFEVRAKTLEQMRLISTLCALADAAAAEMDAAAA